MPRVQIAENVVPIARATGERFRAADNGGGIAGGLADGLQELGGATLDYARQEQARQTFFNEASAKQAYNMADAQKRDVLYTGENAYFNLTGAAAIDAQKSVTETLSKVRETALAGLKDKQAKRMFGDAWDAQIGAEMVRVANHANRELKTYGIQQAQARQTTAADNAMLNVDDRELFGKFVTTGENEIASEGALSGWAPEVVQAKQRAFRSGIQANVIGQKAIHDPVGAAAYMVEHLADLTPGDAAKLQQGLYGPMMERQAAADVDGLMNTTTGAMIPLAPVAPGAGDGLKARMVAITAFTESRNRDRDASGRIVTSAKGAQGRMQVMPGTNRDPGFGVRPAQDNSDEERARVGRDYLSAMMRRYGNDPAKAWAAYNAGPGAVDKLVADHGRDWLQHAVKETRDYVATNVAALGGKRGQSAPTFAPRRDDLAGLYAAIDAQPWDYERKKQARQEVDQRVARDDRLKARDEADAKDTALETVMRMGSGFTSINQLPLDLRNRLSPEVVMSLTSQAEQNVKPKAVEANGEAVIKLHQLAALNPDAFVTTDLRLFRPYMTAAEFDQLSTDQAKMQNKPEERVSYAKVNGAINFYGKDAGLKAGTPDGNAVFTLMRNTLNTVTQGKRQPTDAEIKVAFDQAVMMTDAPGRLWGTRKVERYKRDDLPQNGIAVPVAEREAIRAQMAKAGLPADDQSIARVYFARQAARN